MTSGSVRVYYSWTVKNPSEASYDAMREVDAQEGPVYVDIPWNNEAEAHAQQVPLTSGGDNDTTLESPLYGAMVGVEPGQNQFSLADTDWPPAGQEGQPPQTDRASAFVVDCIKCLTSRLIIMYNLVVVSHTVWPHVGGPKIWG